MGGKLEEKEIEEWVELIYMAKELGLTIEEIREFLSQASK